MRNEICLTNVRTGKTSVVRADRGDESAVDMVRVSPLKQYFMVVFKDGPPELWDLRHLTLIRTLPKRFPVMTALEWLPSHLHRHARQKSVSNDDSDPGKLLAHFNDSNSLFFFFIDYQFGNFTLIGCSSSFGRQLPSQSQRQRVLCLFRS